MLRETVCDIKEITFADSIESLHDRHERMIAADLWRWSSASDNERLALIANTSDLPGAIEYYLCGALEYDPAVRGWWCDGVVELSVSELSELSFRIVGAAYWAKAGRGSTGFHLAPFELEFYFPSVGHLLARKTIFRFGAIDDSGDIQCERYDAKPARIIQKRPRANSDWAIAIELTPPENNGGATDK